MFRLYHQLNGHEFEQTQRQRRTEEPSMLSSMGLQRVRHDLVAEQLFTEGISVSSWYSVERVVEIDTDVNLCVIHIDIS